MRPRHPFRHTPHTFRGPKKNSTEGRSGRVRMPPHHPFRHTPRTFRGLIWSSTESPSGTAHMRPPAPFRHTPHTFRGPIGSSTEGPSGRDRMRDAPISAHPSHVSWPHREPHRRPQRLRPHASPTTDFGTPLTRFVAPLGALPKMIFTSAVLTTAYAWALRQANSLVCV